MIGRRIPLAVVLLLQSALLYPLNERAPFRRPVNERDPCLIVSRTRLVFLIVIAISRLAEVQRHAAALIHIQPSAALSRPRPAAREQEALLRVAMLLRPVIGMSPVHDIVQALVGGIASREIVRPTRRCLLVRVAGKTEAHPFERVGLRTVALAGSQY